MAKTVPQPEEFRLSYDLKTCTDPLVRLGIHGLWRVLHYAGIKRYAHLYPNLVQSDHLSWTLTDTTIEIVAKTTDDLAIVLKSMFGSMPRGIIVPPGYEYDPNETGFYLTGLTHVAVAGFLFKNAKAGRTKSMGTATLLEIGEGKAHPDDVVGLPVKKGAVPVLDLVCKMKGLNPGSLIKKVSGGTRPNKKKTPIEMNVSLHCPDPVLGKSTLFKSLADQMIATLVTNKYNMDRPIATASPFHPLCGTWENKGIQMPFRDAFAVYFSAFGYVYTTCSEGFIGVGMDFPSFKEADQYHKFHKGDFGLSTNEGFISRIHGNAQVAAFVLLNHLKCPSDQSYSIVSLNGKYPTAWDFYFPKGEENAPLDPYGKFRDALYGKFKKSLAAGMEYEDEKKILRILRLVPLEAQGDKYKSVYDQVFQNLTYGSDWHHNLWKAALLKRPNPQNRKEQYEGLFLEESKALQALVDTMTQSDTEKMIREAARKLLQSVAAKFKEQGYKANNYERAREYVVKINMARAVGKESLVAALCRIQAFADHSFPTEVHDAILEMAASNPRGLKSLLILGTMSYNPKAVTETVEA